MNTAQRLAYSANDGFLAFKRRLEEQMIIAGFGMFDETDEAKLRNFYRMGENETYVLDAFGCRMN